MAISGLLGLIIWILIVGLIFAVLWWVVNTVGLPAPFAMVARAILVILAVIVLIYLLLGVMPALPGRLR